MLTEAGWEMGDGRWDSHLRITGLGTRSGVRLGGLCVHHRRAIPADPLGVACLRALHRLTHQRFDFVGFACHDAIAPDFFGPSGVAEHERVWAAVLSLPPRQRAVMVLRYYEDLSEADIAATLDMAPGTVKSNAHAASRRLAVLLAEPAPPPDASAVRTASSAPEVTA